jgi:hypothetical protein
MHDVIGKGNATRTCLLPTLSAAQSLENLQRQRTPRSNRSLRTTHSHTKEQYNKIKNSTPIIANININSRKLIYLSRRTHDIKNAKNIVKTHNLWLKQVTGACLREN